MSPVTPHPETSGDRPWARSRSAALTLITVIALAACGPDAEVPPEPTVIDDAALASDPSGTDWRAYGRTSDEQRFSPLDQVNEGNVADLSVDWFVELPTDRGLVSTPLVVDGVLYFVGSMNVVRAVDATSGEFLWEYDPRVRDHARRMQAGWDHNRGIAYYKGRVYAATWDGRLNAIDAATGEEVWSTMTVDPEAPLYITGAPKVFKNMVLIGNGGTENGPMRGYVTAYHADTGEQAWRFWIVPGNPADGFENEAMEMAAETWTGEWWVHGGGGNAWHGFTYDAELDQLYIGTGNGSPWNRKVRSPGGGDNLFLCSLVALHPDTGEYLWHIQQSPGETWDYNSNMDIVLADLEIEGRARKVILHAPKTGFFYVIDRTTGELISAEPFTKTTWASHIDMETGRPVEVPGARYEDGEAEVTPGPAGAHSWHAMSFNPGTGLAYYPAIHWNWRYSDTDLDLETWRSEPWIGGLGVSYEMLGSTRADGAYSTLQAWNPVRQELVWEVPQPGKFSPGTLTTAGNLVFQGRVDGTFIAYAADTGEELWHLPLGLGISAPPISYSVDGRQYIALLVGWGGALAGLGGAPVAEYGWAYGAQTRMLVAFSLEGTATLPPRAEPVIPTPVEAEFDVVPRLAEAGATTFGRCGDCHGPDAISAGMAPDLRASLLIQSPEAFAEVVRDGSRAANGMPIFPELTDDELLELRNYIRQQAELGLAEVGGAGSE
jgi:quinohemoprotein ethanol dehydrogenase